MTKQIYATTYCNQGHFVDDGKPVNHECHVLPPKAIELEIADDFAGACAEIDKHKPLRVHRGVKQPLPGDDGGWEEGRDDGSWEG